MASPESPQHGLVFDLGALEQELRRESAYERDGHTARTLTRVPDLRVVLMVMKAGSRMAEHQANETASIHVVSGRVELQLPDRIVDLPSGQLLVLAPSIRHDVVATADSALVLTLGWPSEK